jgi:hypothetical protein
MFDVHSIEFYVIALFVAFALLGLIVGHREPGPATSDIVELVLTAEEGTTGTPMLTLQSQPDGTVLLTRTGLPMRPGETAHLVVTVVDDKVNVVEKRGVRSPGNVMIDHRGQAVLTSLRNRRYYVRYDSAITEHWGTVRFNHLNDNRAQCELKM